jgi:Skp family chaperone for outer membrane proteins
MKKFMQIGLLSVALAGFGFAGWAAEQKIATFNLRKAFDSYYKTKQSDAALHQEATEVDKERAQMVESGRKHEDEWRKLIDKANDQAVSPGEREKSKQAAAQKYAELESDKQNITEYERMANARLSEKQKLRRDDIVKEIVGVLNAHAKAAGYSLVLDTSGDSANMVPVALYTNGQDDLTEGIIKELNAAAPVGSLADTNAPAAPSSTNVTNTLSHSK